MSSVEIGRVGEQTAVGILQKEGFSNIQWLSSVKWNTPIDFKAEKDNKECFVEVKYSKYGYFPLEKIIFKFISLNKQTPVFVLFLSKNSYILKKLEDIVDYSSIDTNEKEKGKVYFSHPKRNNILLIDKILKAIPEEPVTVSGLSKIAHIHPNTISKWVQLIEFMQKHRIKIGIIKIGDETKTFRISHHKEL